VAAYHRAFTRNEEASREKLKKAVQWVTAQGFEARELLYPGLSDQDLRALCWNVSSFLEDEDMTRIFG